MIRVARRPAGRKRTTQAELRLNKDLDELCYSKFMAGNTCVRVSFPDGRCHGKRLSFNCSISPQEGLYRGGVFNFVFEVPSSYPFQAPRVVCTTKVLHANIDWKTGAVALRLLGRDWKPVLSINTVIFGLQLLFLEPDLEHAQQKDMVGLIQNDFSRFQRMVRQTMMGGVFWGVYWPPSVLGQSASTNSVVASGKRMRKEMMKAGSTAQQSPDRKRGRPQQLVLPGHSATRPGLKRLRDGGRHAEKRPPMSPAKAKSVLDGGDVVLDGGDAERKSPSCHKPSRFQLQLLANSFPHSVKFGPKLQDYCGVSKDGSPSFPSNRDATPLFLPSRAPPFLPLGEIKLDGGARADKRSMPLPSRQNVKAKPQGPPLKKRMWGTSDLRGVRTPRSETRTPPLFGESVFSHSPSIFSQSQSVTVPLAHSVFP